MNIALSPLPLVGMSTWNVYLHIFSLTWPNLVVEFKLAVDIVDIVLGQRDCLITVSKDMEEVSNCWIQDVQVFTWSSISSNFGKTLGIFLTIIERADIPDDVCNDYGNIMDVIRVSWCVTCLRWSLTWYQPHRRAGDLHSSCGIKVSFRRQPEQPARWISCYDNWIVMAPCLCS